jgi:hypothetical protein
LCAFPPSSTGVWELESQPDVNIPPVIEIPANICRIHHAPHLTCCICPRIKPCQRNKKRGFDNYVDAHPGLDAINISLGRLNVDQQQHAADFIITCCMEASERRTQGTLRCLSDLLLEPSSMIASLQTCIVNNKLDMPLDTTVCYQFRRPARLFLVRYTPNQHTKQPHRRIEKLNCFRLARIK